MTSFNENYDDSVARDNVQCRIIEIVGDFTKRPSVRIGPDTGLIFDLGISDDDGDLLFAEVTKVFPIDMTGSDLGDRFGSDGWWPWEIPLAVWQGIRDVASRWMLGSLPRDRLEQDVYIREIVDAALAGKWMSEPK